MKPKPTMLASLQRRNNHWREKVSIRSAKNKSGSLVLIVPTSWHESETMLKRCEDGLGILNRVAFCQRSGESFVPVSSDPSHHLGSLVAEAFACPCGQGGQPDPIFSCLQQPIQDAQRAHKFRRLRWRDSPSLAGWQQ